MSADSLQLAQQFVSILPHSQHLGMEVLVAKGGHGEMRMAYAPELIGDPRTGVIFGGAVSALLDTCSGVAVFTHPKAAAMMATLDIRIDYMRAATPGQAITARADCFRVTQTIAFVRATALDDNTDDPVATAVGAFTIDRARVGK